MMNKRRVAPFESFESSGKLDKLRRQIQDIVDGKAVAVMMACVTVWVLFGDDIRLVATSQSADNGFFISFFICLLLFSIEIIMNSIFLPDYKFTFFFWLDVIATLSLVPDIPLIRDPFFELFGATLYQVNVAYDTSTKRNTLKESYVTRGIQTIRYIRLVRIVKLYKYFTKKKTGEAFAQNVSSTMDAEVLGKKLSDITTRRVIIGVLSLLLLLPLLQIETVDNAKYYGLQQLYWVGSSGYASDLSGPNITYMNSYGWDDMVVRYALNSDGTEGGSTAYPLLWLYVPNLKNNGTLEDILSATDIISGETWQQQSDCAGKIVPSNCSLRAEEMTIVVYGPAGCSGVGCGDVKAYARFNTQNLSQNQAQMSLIITVFVGFILAAASVMFARDTQRIVIKPVNKMVTTIKNLAKDPLKVTEHSDRPMAKESILEETIDKIGTLLRINFGERGSLIMSELLAENEISFKTEGKKEMSVIAIVKIQDSAAIIDSLQEEVLVFINKIAKIVHTCAVRWQGSICKNEMGSFLITWPEAQATEALFAMIKTSAELHRATDIMAYKSNPKIITKFNDNNYLVDIQIGLHIGEVIEGPIGSSIKVMPDYISPSISMTRRVQSLNSMYGTNLLMTDSFYSGLHENAQGVCRKIDIVALGSAPEQFDLFTFDLSEVSMPNFKRVNANDDEYKMENRKPGDPIIENMENKEYVNFDAHQLFRIDNDIRSMKKCIPSSFNDLFSAGLEAYKRGAWPDSIQTLDHAMELKPQDGPSLSLKKFMESLNSKAPENWQGFRQIP